MKIRPFIIFIYLYLSLITFSGLSLMDQNDQDELKSNAPQSNGYIILENVSFSASTGANGQLVYMLAPTLQGQVQLFPDFQALLNNVKTDTGFFLQNGIGIDNPANGGAIAWTTTNQNLTPRSYAKVPYYAGHVIYPR